MATTLLIQEEDHALLLRVQQSHGHLQSLLSGAIAAVVIAAFLHQHLPMQWLIPICLIVGALSYVAKNRIKNVVLRVTSVEFTTTGFFEGGGVRFHRFVPTADVRWLEYRPETGGGEAAYHPKGLYAVTRSGVSCVLPYLEEQETATVISRIEARFPAFAERWRAESPFGEHYLTLGLPGQK